MENTPVKFEVSESVSQGFVSPISSYEFYKVFTLVVMDTQKPLTVLGQF